MKQQKRPPKNADRLLSWFCKTELLEGIAGDLHEFWDRAEQKGFRTQLQYWYQVLHIMRPFAFKRLKLLQHNFFTMIRFNLLLSFRNMRRNKLYTALNVAGLSLAFISCLFIALYVLDEQSFDSHWEDADRIHRLNHYSTDNGRVQEHIQTQVIIGDFLKEEYPEIKGVGRVSQYLRRKIAKGDKWIEQEKIGIAEQSFIDLFSFKALHGNLEHALEDVNTIILTESVAKKYFGESDVVGQSILMNDSSQFKVTCVIEDIPDNTHFQYQAFMNNGAIQKAERSWAFVACLTYVNIDPKDRPVLEEKIYDMIVRNGAEDWETAYGITDLQAWLNRPGFEWGVELLPVKTIYLDSDKGELESSGNRIYITIMISIGMFLAFIAIFNFINLSTAKAANRIKEITVKRILGSQKRQLMTQFLTEALLFAFLAIAISVVVSYVLIGDFNQLTSKTFKDPFFNQFGLWRFVLPTGLALGLLAGIYPAYHLSRLEVAHASQVSRNVNKSYLRNVFVIMQFTVSTILILGSVSVLWQLNYLNSKDLGFDYKNTLVVYLGHLRLGQTDPENDPKRILFANELKKNSRFTYVTSSTLVPMGNGIGNTQHTMFSLSSSKEETIRLRHCEADHGLIPTLGLEIVEGRNFRSEEPDEIKPALVSVSAAKSIGKKDLIGSSIYLSINDEEFKIVGIFKDFNYAALHRKIDPIMIRYDGINDQTLAKFTGSSFEAYQEAEKIWDKLFPNDPMVAEFMEDMYTNQYLKEKQMSRILLIGTTLAIFIACLGLFGLSTYSTEQRKKEIGIRKVMGATSQLITRMLVAGFTRPIILALIIGLPIAYYYTNSWLENFAYRIEVGWEIIFIAGLLTMVLGILTVSFLSFKSASQDPTENLRYE